MRRCSALALGLLLLAGCASREPAPQPPPSPEATPEPDGEHTHVLRLDKPVRSGDGLLEVVWLRLDDSRCPIGVTCVWAGEVTLSLDVTEKGRETTRIELSLWPGKDEAASASVGAWRLQLLSVDPYPREGVRTERADFRAVLTVSRLR